MSVYMGQDGCVMIRRTTIDDDSLMSVLSPDDVNTSRRRFSFDFPQAALISGDRIEIYTQDGTPLELVAGHTYPDGRWYCHVDDAGGVRLYEEFWDAINGGYDSALPLVVPTRSTNIIVRTRNSRYRGYGQMRTWEITTSRQTIDTTTLGEEFIQQYARGLLSGQGAISCIWDYQQAMCDPMQLDSTLEEPHYLCQLLLRLKQGSLFQGQFMLYKGKPSVWYEADCIVTNAGLSFAPGEVVESRIDFVTTGAITLHTGQPEAFLLQEDGNHITQESNDLILLDDPT